MTYQTPIIQYFNLNTDNEIFIKREDLLPFSFGGNKVRIAYEYFEDMENQGKNCMVGYGNVRSNLCRVLANMSFARTGKRGYCHIILSSDNDGTYQETNNSLITKNCGAIIHNCSKQNVAETVDRVMMECKNAGMKPYYIYGDRTGCGNEAVPIRAYRNVYNEFKQEFDYIFLATGTGMTQAGLIAGKIIEKGNEKIVGISVARERESEIPVIHKYLEKYFESVGINEKIDEVLLTDDYIGENYGGCSEDVIDTIQLVMKKCGIALDPTYTGKAFYGMIDLLEKYKIKGKRVLFIHTGGLPLFFDQSSAIFK